MKESADKLLESVVEKAMKFSELDSPQSGFTNMVMARVNSQSTATMYKPLISKTGWMIIVSSVTVFVVFLYQISGVEVNGWFEMIDFDLVTDNQITSFFSKLELATVTFYAIFVCGLMLCAQIPILKYFIDKRQQGFS